MDNRIERTNFNHLVADIAWFGLALAAIVRFLSMYAVRLHASEWEQGLLVALPGLAILISASLAGWWRAKFASSGRAMILPGFVMRLTFLLPAFTPFFSPEWQVTWLIAATTIPALANGACSAIFLMFVRESVSDAHLTRLWGWRTLLLNIALGAMTLGFAALLERLPYPFNYQVMFVLAFGFSLVSMWYVVRTKALYPMPIKSVTDKSVTDKSVTDQSVERLWRLPAFQTVVFVTLIAHVAYLSINGLVPMFLVERFAASEQYVGWFSLAELAAGAMVALSTNRLVKWIGNRSLVSLSLLGLAIAAVLTAVAPSLEVTLLAAALTGAAWTTTSIGVFGVLIENTAPEHTIRATMAFQQMVSLGTFIGPLIGSLLAEAGLTLVTVLLIGAGIRSVAAVLVQIDFSEALRPRRKWRLLRALRLRRALASR